MYLPVYEVYYNNHYSEGNKTIRFVLEDELSVSKTDYNGKEEEEKVGIYRVETK